MANIIFNKNNITNPNNGNNKLRYNFPVDALFKSGDQIATSHINIFYSWFNISAAHGNNFFQYKWWDMNGDLTVIVDVLIKDGYYSQNTLYEYIQSIMVSHGHYLVVVDGGDYVYFIDLVSNETYYSFEFRLSSVGEQIRGSTASPWEPTEQYWKLPTTWKLPALLQTPEIIIPSNNNFGLLLGFTPQTIVPLNFTAAYNKTYSILNNFAPEMEPSSSFIITCNLVDNNLSFDSKVLTSFTIPNGTRFGDMINLDHQLIFSNIKPGQYTTIELSILDQDYNNLRIIDPNILIVLTIKHD